MLLEFQRTLISWVEDGNSSANLKSMFEIFFMFFFNLNLLSLLSSLIISSKLYTSFTQTILVADEHRNAIRETTFLPNLPMFTQIHNCEQLLCQQELEWQVSIWNPYWPNKYIHEDILQ